MKKLFLIFKSKFHRFLAGCNFRNGNGVVSNRDERTPASVCSGVNSENLVPLVEEIINLLEVQQIYKTSNLDLNALSERLKAPAYMVTRAINEGLGVNFYDLINRYRVEEVKSLLKNYNCKKFTLLAVAFDAGFSSKTTFNTVFKKMTGLTPSSYRDQYLFEDEIARMDQSSSVIKRMKATRVGHLAN